MPKNSASKSAGVVKESAAGGVELARAVGVRVVEVVEVPAAVGRELADGVGAGATRSHSPSGELTPPGNRQAIETMAIGSSAAAFVVVTAATAASAPSSSVARCAARAFGFG